MANRARPTFRPVVFLGLGSTGAKIISKIHALVKANGDELATRFHQFAYITSESSQEAGVDVDITHLGLSSSEMSSRDAVDALDDNNDEAIRAELRRWWYFEDEGGACSSPYIPAVPNLETGVGGTRSIGRMLVQSHQVDDEVNLFEWFNGINGEIEKARARMDTFEQAQIDTGSIVFHVIGLLAGGTCSGIFHDIGFAIRSTLGARVHLFGTFLLGDICYKGAERYLDTARTATQKANTCFALAELCLMHSEQGRTLIRDNWLNRLGRHEFSRDAFDQKLFDHISLIGATNQGGKSLQDFVAYQDFVAEYYASFYTSSAAQQEAGRLVDDLAQDMNRTDAQAPFRPNCFSRIGRLGVRVPEARILGLARSQLVHRMAASSLFKNAESERVSKALGRMQKGINWGALDKRFTPPTEGQPDVTDAEFYPLPETAGEFRDIWEAKKRNLDAYYGSFHPVVAATLSPDSGKAGGVDPWTEGQLKAFRQAWETEIDKLQDDFLGVGSEGSLSLGSLTFVIRSLLGGGAEPGIFREKLEAEERIARELEDQLFAVRDKRRSLSEAFQQTLDEQTEDFPEKRRLDPFREHKRRSWAGAGEVADALGAYAATLSKYVTSEIIIDALRPIVRQLQIMAQVRKLVASNSAAPVFGDIRSEADDLFDEASYRDETWEEIVTKRDDIETLFVKPILQAPSDDDSARTVEESVIDGVLGNWLTKDSDNLTEMWKLLIEQATPLAEDAPPRNAEQLAADSLVAALVKRVQVSLRRSISSAVEEKLAQRVRDISVWEAIETYVREKGEDPDHVLKAFFKVLFEKAAYFPRLSNRARRDNPTKRERQYYLCQERDAAACFERLGLRDPDTYLDTLFRYALGRHVVSIGGNETPKGQMLFFFTRTGELPTYIEGFEEVSALLQDPPIIKRGDERLWVDRRFPEWIHEWHSKEDAEPGFIKGYHR